MRDGIAELLQRPLRSWMDNDDGLPPIEQEGDCCQGEPGRLVREAARTLLTFQKQAELFPKKEILCGERRFTPHYRCEKQKAFRARRVSSESKFMYITEDGW